MKTQVIDVNGKTLKEIELDPAIFEIKPNNALIHQVVTAERANQRAGTASTKTRGLVRGGGRKPHKQKGTGRARAGSTRSPLWRGGGTVFGPHPRDYSQKIPRKMKRLALKSILSAKAKDAELIVVDSFGLTEPKTKRFSEILTNIKAPNKVTVIVATGEEMTVMSIRNLVGANAIYDNEISAYELLNNKAIIFTEEAFGKVTEVLRG